MNGAPPAQPACTPLFVEAAQVIARQEFAAQQYIYKFAAPQCARAAQPGQFIRLSGADGALINRPLAVLRAHAAHGTVEILFTANEPELTALASQPIGASLNLSGPIGEGFIAHLDKPRPILMGAGDGIAAMIFLAEWLQRRSAAGWQPLVLLHSDLPWVFRTRPSTIMVDGMPPGVIAALTLCDERGIASRLSSYAELPGCHAGSAVELAEAWLATLNSATLKQVELFACGATALLQASTELAQRFNVACQVRMAVE